MEGIKGIKQGVNLRSGYVRIYECEYASEEVGKIWAETIRIYHGVEHKTTWFTAWKTFEDAIEYMEKLGFDVVVDR